MVNEQMRDLFANEIGYVSGGDGPMINGPTDGCMLGLLGGAIAGLPGGPAGLFFGVLGGGIAGGCLNNPSTLESSTPTNAAEIAVGFC